LRWVFKINKVKAMKKINLSTISALIALLSCMLFPVISHAGDFIQPISETDASVSNPQSMSRIQSFSARKYTDKVLTVSINAESLKQNSITINIPGEGVILLYPEFLNSQSKVPFSWVSAPPSIWVASAEIGVYDGIVSGEIKISRQIDGTKVTPGRTYEIRHLQGNTYALRKFDHNKMRQPGDEGFPIPLTSPPSAPQKKATSVTPDKKALAATAANPIQVDIQLVYTKKFPSTRNIPTKLGTANADNARVLNEQAQVVAAFRPTRIGSGGAGSGGLVDTLKKYLPILFNILN
jgi:hypothetical protein